MEHAPGETHRSAAAAAPGHAGTRLPDVCRWALCGVLALSAAAKLLTPHRDEYAVPEHLYYLGAAVELAAVVLLLTRFRPAAIAMAIALALAGITLAMVLPGRPCGCLGSLMQLEGTSHVLLSGIVGALACLSIGPRAAQRVPSVCPPAPCHGDVPR